MKKTQVLFNYSNQNDEFSVLIYNYFRKILYYIIVVLLRKSIRWNDTCSGGKSPDFLLYIFF